MKVAVVLGINNDSQYLREYVQHYLSIGVDTLIMFDNNDTDGDDPRPVLEEFKHNIILIDKRGDKSRNRQWSYYTEALIKYKREDDWMCFFDNDEFLFLNKHKSIKHWLSMPFFKDVDCIHVNWKMYGDNGWLYPAPELSTFEQFKHPCPLDLKAVYPFPHNNHVKTIVHCTQKPIYFSHPHICYTTNGSLIAVNASGKRCDSNSPFCPYDFEYAELRHYQLRSTLEFCQKRLGRGPMRFDGSIVNAKQEIEWYFMYNKRTPEKEELIKKYCKENNIRL